MCEIIDGKTTDIWSFIYDRSYMIIHIWSFIYEHPYMNNHMSVFILKIQTHPGGGFHDLNFCVAPCWCPCSCSSHTLADWNTLFHCIFWQIGTLCFIVFLTDLNTSFGYIFGRFKQLVSLHFSQIWTPYLVVPFGRLRNRCFVAFLADWNTCFIVFFDRFKHLVSLNFWQI